MGNAQCVKIVDGKIKKTIYLSKFKDCDGNFLLYFIYFYLIGSIKKTEYCGRPLGIRRKSETEFLVADAVFGIFKINFEKGLILYYYF